MRLVYCFASLALLLLASCETQPAIVSSGSGQDRCYSGFLSEMSSLVPEDAHKCGIFTNAAEPAADCAKKAVASQNSFIFGYQSFGDDSMYCHAAARDANGQLLDIFYDAGMIGTDGNDAFIQISRCQAIVFRPGTIGIGSFFATEGCTDAPDIVKTIIAGRQRE